jgi:ribonuclease D
MRLTNRPETERNAAIRPQKIPSMNLITTTAELEAAVADLSKSDFVTVDTEFIRETTFWPELCLIQMASPDVAVLIDPLAPGIELKPFFDLMSNEAVTKVFHAARQDIEIVFHLGGLIPHPVFDTQVAAMVCGFGDSVSYEQIVNKVTGAHIDKSSRFTDWRARPLSVKQLDYALADVTHLIEVYAFLKAELEREGRAEWLNEEMAVLTAPETYDPHPDDAWKRLKLRLRRPIEMAVAQSVAAWRDREARDKNVPRRRVIKDETVAEVAQQQPRDAAALGKLRSIPKGWERSSAASAMLDAVNSAFALPKDKLPVVAKPTQNAEGTSAAAELLKVLLRLVAEDCGVAGKLLASSDDIERIAALGEMADVPAMHGWRREVFGNKAVKLVRGEISLKFENRKIVAVG